MMGCECYVVFIFFNGAQDGDSTEIYYLSIFMLLLNPIFTLIGVPFSASNLRKEDKIFFCAIVCSYIPLIICVPLFFYIVDSDLNLVLSLSVISPPLSTLYWAILALINSKNRTLYQIFVGSACLLLVFPIGFLFPMMISEELSIVTTLPIILLLIGIPVMIGIIFIT